MWSRSDLATIHQGLDVDKPTVSSDNSKTIEQGAFNQTASREMIASWPGEF